LLIAELLLVLPDELDPVEVLLGASAFAGAVSTPEEGV
jgi:hypothetical protein